MDTAKLALTRVDELERRVLALSTQTPTLTAFEMRNDFLFEYVSNVSNYKYTFLPFTPVAGTTLTFIFNANIEFLEQTSCTVSLYAFDSCIISQQINANGIYSISLAKTINAYESKPCELVLEISAQQNLLLTLQTYSLNIVGNILSAADGVISKCCSADVYIEGEMNFKPNVPEQGDQPDQPEPLPDPSELEGIQLSSFNASFIVDVAGNTQFTQQQIEEAYSQLESDSE